MQELLDWCRFLRLDNALLSIGGPLIGAIAQNPSLPVWQALALAAVGMCAHVHGFVLNDVMDWELDSMNPAKRGKPLLNGFMAKRSALLVAWIQLPMALALGAIPPAASLGSELLLVLSCAFATIYNLYGKRFPAAPVIADACLGSSVGTIVIWGAVVTEGKASPLVIAIAIYIVVQLALINMLMGLQDLGHDLAFGARTSSIWLGARPGSDAKPQVSNPLRSYTMVVAFAVNLFLEATLLANLWGLSADTVRLVSLAWLLISSVSVFSLIWYLWINSLQVLLQVYYDLGYVSLLVMLGARAGAQTMVCLFAIVSIPVVITYPAKLWARYAARQQARTARR